MENTLCDKNNGVKSRKSVCGIDGVYDYDEDGNLISYSGTPPRVVEGIKKGGTDREIRCVGTTRTCDTNGNIPHKKD
jgi:hypothetical protein